MLPVWIVFSWVSCSVHNEHGSGNNADADGVPDYIDASPLDDAVNTEIILPMGGGVWKGSMIRDGMIVR